jgi:DNA adenine methylase
LKWAGGKRQLLPQLRRFYPHTFTRYIEPFFGSGAVFFDLHGAGSLRGHDVFLLDSNADLIGMYETVRDRPEDIARALEQLAIGHARRGRQHYYDVRDRQFNPRRLERRGADGRIAYTPELAAMFIYLNRTGFNGLFRLNSTGAFNVPAGRYERPAIADRARLMGVADALRAPNVRLELGTFEAATAAARRGDFLYVDPPYAPLSRTASFTAYTPSGFTAEDQRRLHASIVELARRGCQVLLSNSTADEIVKLYERDPETAGAGLRSMRVRARRAINSRGQGRGPIEEYLITNISEVSRLKAQG